MDAVTSEFVFETLTKKRLVGLYQELGLDAPPERWTKAQCIKDLALISARAKAFDLVGLLALLHRNELELACRGAGHEGQLETSRAELASRLIGHPVDPAVFSLVAGRTVTDTSAAPESGDVVWLRQRHYLVKEVLHDSVANTHRVDLVCIDDDDQGREVVAIWEAELGARVVQSNKEGLGEPKKLDDPRDFAAYLQTIRWQAVTASDAEIFQAPFRSGIQHAPYQMTALMKALRLPRVNLFIADDVGLGKTIEAGLVTLELMLRQRVDWILVVCPPSVCYQWQMELSERFGLDFALYSKDFVRKARVERGFHTNPWSTHNRFIISYQLLRRPEHREPLLQHLQGVMPRSLLIMDEAHTVAPSSPGGGSKRSFYAVDSQLTHIARQVAPRFEHRLFLSATPHNGHSNSFSALLELLDPQRFTRGIPIKDPVTELAPIMVRRLKSDLRRAGERFPHRRIVTIGLGFDEKTRQWEQQERWDNGSWSSPVAIGEGTQNREIKLARDFNRYMECVGTAGQTSGVLIQLQKILLSSVAAFAASIKQHAWHAGALPSEHRIKFKISEEAKAILRALESDAQRAANMQEAKLLSLLAWIRTHQTKTGKTWTETRLLVFTEYHETLDYIRRHLAGALGECGDIEKRVGLFKGGEADNHESLKQEFNGPPAEFPLRILLATDAAREGINLHTYCADVLHYDLPWNPSRLEQRNGRIDRKGGADEVRCMYFKYLDRPEDQLLDTLVLKSETIRRELGSLGAVVGEKVAALLEKEGLSGTAKRYLEATETLQSPRALIVQAELDKGRFEVLEKELKEATKRLEMSKKRIHWSAESIMTAMDTGCRLASEDGNGLGARTDVGKPPMAAYELPPLAKGWWPLLDPLRPAKEDVEQTLWKWRDTSKPRPVVFEAPSKPRIDVYQLHLQHPFVQRLFGRFRSSGFGGFDLSGISAVVGSLPNKHYAIAFGRLILYNEQGGRLHDQWLAMSATLNIFDRYLHTHEHETLEGERAMAEFDRILNSPERLESVPVEVAQQLVARQKGDYERLWPLLEELANNEVLVAEKGLKARAEHEAAELKRILEAQLERLSENIATTVDTQTLPPDQQQQFKLDREYWGQRFRQIREELKVEPDKLRSLYTIALRRFEPVGLLYLWGRA